MNFIYNSKARHLIIDGNGSKILTKRGINIKNFDGDFTTEFKNLYVEGDDIKGFRNKMKQSILSLRYIWR